MIKIKTKKQNIELDLELDNLDLDPETRKIVEDAMKLLEDHWDWSAYQDD